MSTDEVSALGKVRVLTKIMDYVFIISGTNRTVEAAQLPSTLVNMRRVRTRVKKKSLGFICAGVSKVGGYMKKEKKNRLILVDLSVTNLLPFEHQRKTVRIFGELWRNQLRRWLEEGCRILDHCWDLARGLWSSA